MSILNTGRQQLAQADALNKQSTNLRNELAASNAGLEMAERNNKQSMRGNALGGMASMAIADGGKSLGFGLSNAAPVGQSLANAEAMGGSGLHVAENAGVQLSSTGTGAATGTAAGTVGTTTGAATTGAATTGAATGTGAAVAGAETTGSLGAAVTSGAGALGSGAGAGASAAAAGGALASAGSAALAAIPYIGWAAAIGSMAYSLFS